MKRLVCLAGMLSATLMGCRPAQSPSQDVNSPERTVQAFIEANNRLDQKAISKCLFTYLPPRAGGLEGWNSKFTATDFKVVRKEPCLALVSYTLTCTTANTGILPALSPDGVEPVIPDQLLLIRVQGAWKILPGMIPTRSGEMPLDNVARLLAQPDYDEKSIFLPKDPMEAREKADLDKLSTAAEAFMRDCHRYPNTEEGLAALMASPPGIRGWKGPYLKKLPKDPWGQAYRYELTTGPGLGGPMISGQLPTGPGSGKGEKRVRGTGTEPVEGGKPEDTVRTFVDDINKDDEKSAKSCLFSFGHTELGGITDVPFKLTVSIVKVEMQDADVAWVTANVDSHATSYEHGTSKGVDHILLLRSDGRWKILPTMGLPTSWQTLNEVGGSLNMGLLEELPRPDIDAKVARAQEDAEVLKSKIEAFQLDCGRFPTTAEGLGALLKAPAGVHHWRGPYLEKLPKDPWGRDYQYHQPGAAGPNTFDIEANGQGQGIGVSGGQSKREVFSR